jgi:hypothetical protein
MFIREDEAGFLPSELQESQHAGSINQIAREAPIHVSFSEHTSRKGDELHGQPTKMDHA